MTLDTRRHPFMSISGSVSAAIPGARNPQQAEALMNAWRAGPLPEETLKRLDELWRTTFSRHIQTSIQGATEG
jgi:aryl-alcohol dehydrogenase-like predicted oxidoreductase